MTLHTLVLGSAAGGGFPQWNCACGNCQAVRLARPGFEVRTQDSVAVSADGEDWFLLNASPDVLRQVQQQPALWPRALRHSPIQGVVLSNGDLDHVLGLFQLRESQPLSLYATQRVYDGLKDNIALRTLQRFEGQLNFQPLELGKQYELRGWNGKASGIFLEPLSVPGKPPLHLMQRYAASAEDNLALRLWTKGSGSLLYASAVADVTALSPQLTNCSALLLDGTFWSEAELPDLGVNMGPARSMAHQPMSGPAGSLYALREVQVAKRFFTHINNTNPVLDASSPQRAELTASGWQVAFDGLRFSVE